MTSKTRAVWKCLYLVTKLKNKLKDARHFTLERYPTFPSP